MSQPTNSATVLRERFERVLALLREDKADIEAGLSLYAAPRGTVAHAAIAHLATKAAPADMRCDVFPRWLATYFGKLWAEAIRSHDDDGSLLQELRAKLVRAGAAALADELERGLRCEPLASLDPELLTAKHGDMLAAAKLQVMYVQFVNAVERAVAVLRECEAVLANADGGAGRDATGASSAEPPPPPPPTSAPETPAAAPPAETPRRKQGGRPTEFNPESDEKLYAEWEKSNQPQEDFIRSRYGREGLRAGMAALNRAAVRRNRNKKRAEQSRPEVTDG